MAVSFKGAHCPPDIILLGIRWSVAYPLSTRPGKERLAARGVEVAPSTMKRWVIQYRPQLEEAFHRRQRPVGVRWRMAATSLQVKGLGRALERAVDQPGPPMAVLRTEHRDPAAARRCLKQAIRRHGLPESMTSDGSDANAATIQRYTEAPGTAIALRQVQYVHNLGEQEHRAVKRVPRPIRGLKAFTAAQDTLVGIELLPMLKKRQRVVEAGDEGRTATALFYSLAA